MPSSVDTIAALATATGGGIGVLRLSGPRSESILRALVPSLPRSLISHKLTLGQARSPETGALLDEVLVVLMRGPRSYTGEDVGELHGHGGAANLARLLSAVIALGARLATPGEFTRRAYLAGKIDLSQAEATAAIIGARDARTLALAHSLRQGSLGRAVEAARRAIVIELAELEGALDFPDEAGADLLDRGAASASSRIEELRAVALAFERAAQSYSRPLGVLPEVILLGRVNAGKSSLLNALCGQERALVDEVEGTTRDLVEAEFDDPELGLLRLIDTAGLRPGPSALESRGHALAEQRRVGAALVLLVFDGAVGWQAGDEALRLQLGRAHTPFLLVHNKADLPAGAAPPGAAVAVSARSGAGLEALRVAIRAALATAGSDELPVASARQAEALRSAAEAIGRGLDALLGLGAMPIAPEVAAVELRRALTALGQLTGESVDQEVLDALFARFCIGK